MLIAVPAFESYERSLRFPVWMVNSQNKLSRQVQPEKDMTTHPSALSLLLDVAVD